MRYGSTAGLHPTQLKAVVPCLGQPLLVYTRLATTQGIHRFLTYTVKNVRLLLLSMLFLLLLNEPIISIVSDEDLIGGIPVLYVYVLIVWALLIGSLAYVIHRSLPSDNSLSDDE